MSNNHSEMQLVEPEVTNENKCQIFFVSKNLKNLKVIFTADFSGGQGTM